MPRCETEFRPASTDLPGVCFDMQLRVSRHGDMGTIAFLTTVLSGD